jgi:predicted phage tail protein
MDDKAVKNQRKNRIGGWILAVWGAAILVRAAINGNLYGATGSYGTGVVIGNALGVAFVVIGLYFGLRKTPKVRQG